MVGLIDGNRLSVLGVALSLAIIVDITVLIGWLLYVRPRASDLRRRNEEAAAAYTAAGLSRTFLHGREFGYGTYEGYACIVTWRYRSAMASDPQFLVWIKTDRARATPRYTKGHLVALYGRAHVLGMLGGDEALLQQGEYQVIGAWTTDAPGALQTLLKQAIHDVE